MAAHAPLFSFLHADRTTPVCSAQTVDPVFIGDANAVVSIPTTMFTDAVSTNSQQIVIVSAVAVGSDHGLQLSGSYPTLSVAELRAASVRSPEGTAVFNVSARDEAGNVASCLLTVPVQERRTCLPLAKLILRKR
ncbi:MAG: hypothetical protein EOO65_02640, partial [Methanosarcinales archaeon]